MSRNRINERVWRRGDVLRDYCGRAGLWAVERRILERYKSDVQDRRLLDVGCGSGRTTAGLLAYSRDYVAMDYSPRMVALFEKRYPGVEVHCGDMRRMSAFEPDRFDLVFCSFNSLDYVSHRGRLEALGEMRRVLMRGGLLVFSSHNRTASVDEGGPRLEVKGGPLTFVRGVVEFLFSVRNHRCNRRCQIIETDYAILNDCGHCYSLLTYYIAREKQLAQLRAAGFAPMAAYDRDGNELVADDADDHSSFIYYVARKGEAK